MAASSAAPGRGAERASLAAVSRAIDANQYVLVQDPSLLVQQLHNALISDFSADTSLGKRLRDAASRYRRPWLRLSSRSPRTRDPALRRVIRVGSQVTAVAVSRDGVVAATGTDNLTRLWDLQTGRLLVQLSGRSWLVGGFAFSPDGLALVSGPGDPAARPWEMPDDALFRAVHERREEVRTLTFSSDGGTIAVGTREGVRLWDMPDGELRAVLRHPDVGAAVFSASGQVIVTGGHDRRVRAWDAQRGEAIWDDDAGLSVRSVACSPDERLLASGGYGDEVTVRDLRSGRVECTLGRPEGDDASDWSRGTYVWSLAFSPDGRMLAAAHQFSLGTTEVRVWDTTTWTRSQTFTVHAYYLSVAFSADNTRLVTADGDVRIWDLGVSAAPSVQIGHRDSLGPVAFSPDRRMLATGSGNPKIEFRSADRNALLWDAQTGEVARVLQVHPGAVIAVAFMRDGHALATVDDEGTVRLWRLADDNCVRAFALGGRAPICIAVSPDGRLLAAGTCKNRVEILDVERGREDRTLVGHEGWVTAVAFGPSGDLLASGSNDGTVRLCDPRTGAVRSTCKGHAREKGGCTTALAFDETGRWLAIGGDLALLVWDVTSGRLQYRAETPWIASLAFSPGGALLATGDYHGTVRVLAVPHGPELCWTTGTGAVLALCFDPWSSQLCVAERDPTRHAPNSYVMDIVRPDGDIGHPIH